MNGIQVRLRSTYSVLSKYLPIPPCLDPRYAYFLRNDIGSADLMKLSDDAGRTRFPIYALHRNRQGPKG